MFERDRNPDCGPIGEVRTKVMEQPKRQLKEDLQVLHIERKKPSGVNRQQKPRRQKRSNTTTVLFVAVPVCALLLFAVFRMNLQSRFGLSAKTVRVAIAARPSANAGATQPLLAAGGYVIARNQVEVGSKITGRVISIEVREGDRVARGQVVARLDEAELNAAVLEAQAKLASSNAALAEVEAGSRPQQIGHANAEVERLAADVKNAERKMRRSEQLVREGVIAQQEYEDDRARYEMAKAAQNGAQEDLSLTRVGPRQEEVQRARADVRQAQAVVALTQAQLENTVIRAPMTGVVLERYVDVGEMVTTGFTSDRGAKQSLFTIADMTDLQVELDISEADISKVSIGQPVTMTPDAYADRRYEGTVEYIASTADRQKATIKVKVRVASPDEYLRPGMGVKATIYPLKASIPQKPSAVLVPAEAVADEGGRKIVYLIKDGKAAAQPVKIGREQGSNVEVLEGLQGGEQVVLDGQVKEGDKLTVRTP
jgi:HlyD family secretion protein